MSKSKVLVVGSGAREHALAEKLATSPKVERVFCAPGNAGTAIVAENVPIGIDELDKLVQFAKASNIGLTVVGPEAPLCAGIVDRFQSAGLRIFGPTAAAARIEGDKAYAKRLMRAAYVPTAEARIFDRYADARAYVATRDDGLVVKAAGLAAGKGVIVCSSSAEAILALEQMMVKREFGDAGSTVVVEELLQGPEVSVHALIDGRTIYLLDSAQDHKRLGDGDIGPNTGGMGAYSPAPVATSEVLAIVERDVLVPIVDALRGDGAPYGGILYVGLMMTPGGPKVLEFNCRFGDPEAEVLLPRLNYDLFDVLSAVVDGKLADMEIQWDSRAAVSVVMASEGYPAKPQIGKVISGLDSARRLPDVHVYHAGTKRVENLVVSSSGRVLAVTGLGETIQSAKKAAYSGVEKIQFEGATFRRDIADKATSCI
ncbi:MAG: phosphoribosylamine--glycine ligase [Planctomycetes bacterium]|nr:phosphoribosylamine--glycine ligase [Planctomycetota bacterium]MBI3835322.1 phosphoribosylamine--glycine ligase [Planctomycetota bacterium]